MSDLIERWKVLNAIDSIEAEIEDGYGFQYEKWKEHFTKMPSVPQNLQPTCNQLATDLISRQAAYETLSEYYHHSTEIQHKGLREALDRVPSAEPRKGKWIETEEYWKCSVCGDEFVTEVGVTPKDARMFYCPVCGADMRGEEE